jgi:CRP/FNR family transcriptional regulator, cyclic AMP receptor protein
VFLLIGASSMPTPEFVGWCAAALMVATFSCRSAPRMRSLAVCTNLAFIAYGGLAGLHPVTALHVLLLPINLFRLFELLRRGRTAPDGTLTTGAKQRDRKPTLVKRAGMRVPAANAFPTPPARRSFPS